ncbi:hypothetical protein RB595_009064 [Gaeumannomyces hyphopodioides]
MSAQDRAQPLSRLPDIEEDRPFSSLFGDAFDMATVESTAQLADSSIFITPSGSRFRFERLADPVPVSAPEKPQSSTLKLPPPPREKPQQPPSPPPEAPVPIVIPATAPPKPPPTAPATGSQTQPPQPHFQLHTRPPQLPRPRPDRRPNAAFPTQTAAAASSSPPASSPRSSIGSVISQRLGALGVGRSASRRDSNTTQHALADANPTAMVEALSLGDQGFGASALYFHSDGGVQAAETLTDSESADRLALGSNAPETHAAGSPHPHSITYHGFPDYQESPTFGSLPSASGSDPRLRHPSLLHRTSTTSHTHSRASTASDLVGPEFTSLDPFSPPAYAQDAPPAVQPRQQYGAGFARGSFQSTSEKQTGPTTSPRSQSLPSLMEYSVVHTPPPHPPGSSSAHSSIAGSSAAAIAIAPTPDAAGDSDRAHTYSYDTQTPVFVRVHSPGPRPPQSSSSSVPPSSEAAPSSPRATIAATDTSSTTGSRDRDNVLPGEEVLYDGAVGSGHALSGPFEDGRLKVFRNGLSRDLRFYCKLGNNSETLWMKGAKARLVPLYGYDQRSLTVQIRDGDSDLEVRQRQQSHQQQYEVVPNGPVAMYQFAALKDLFAFQSQLTGEQVVLDISSVKWIRLAKANSRSIEMYSSVRLQIWHEPRSGRAAQSDVASFVTAGTALSGPLRERVIPNSSRLMIFLSRSEQYITSFITDDIEMEAKGLTSASLKPRKYGGGFLDRRSSRPAGIRARLEKKSGSEPAGLSIPGEPYNPDVEQTFDLYKTFEIEFESSPSQINFVQAWNEVIEARRKQRARLAQIQEDMTRHTFSSRAALDIWA